MDQMMKMKALFPDWQCGVKRNVLTCIGYRQPTEISCNYKVKITYTLNGKPDIEVLEPKLVCREGETAIPHVYPGNHPCVYYPKFGEWTSSKYIAKTIVPWISSWLYFYEVWMATGEWEGGGIHPKVNSKTKI